MEQIIGLKELRQNVSAYAKKVKQGQSFIVVKQSKPLFKISPIIPEADEHYHDPNYETLIDFTKIRKGGVDARDVLKALKKLRHGQNR